METTNLKNIPKFYGLTDVQWAILFAWDKEAECSIDGALALRRRYLNAYNMYPQEKNNFGVIPEMDFEKTYKLLEIVHNRIFPYKHKGK